VDCGVWLNYFFVNFAIFKTSYVKIATMDNLIVNIAEATIWQGDKQVLREVNFQIAKSEFVYLIGKTGSGKSSLLRTLYADLPFADGVGSVVGYDLRHIKRSQIPYLRRTVGIVFQDFQLFTDRNIAQNLYFVMEATGWQNKAKMLKRMHFVLMQVGLESAQYKMPHQLSGGEQQRIAIARALINDPEIIFADEPTGNLDPTIANEILDLFVKINQGGTAILMATHNHSFLRKHPARVLYCDNFELKDLPKEQVLKKL
jgi:cell division transport system ATP-binding protein